jgi:acyl dehydratase
MATLFILVSIGTVMLSAMAWSCYRLTSIFRGTKNSEISFSPHELRLGEVFVAIFAMMIKSASNRALTWKIGSSTDEISLTSPFYITNDDISRYHDAVGRPKHSPNKLSSSALPVFLAAVTEPAMLLLLMHPHCPINPLGAVNVRNRFEILRPDLCQLSLFKSEHAAGLVATFRNKPRSVKRGFEFDLEVAIMVPDKTKTGLTPVFRQIFTMLEFRKTHVASEKSQQQTKRTPMSPRLISFPTRSPMLWASLCKDYNFIHLSGYAARLFGLPGKLAHGNHIVAQALRELENEGESDSTQMEPIWMEVNFKKPVVVPCVLEVEMQATTGGAKAFSIYKYSQLHVLIEQGKLVA